MNTDGHFPFGRPNFETAARWLGLPSEHDGPVWMVNLMRYHAVARYDDDPTSTITGKEADDAYAPLGPLAAIGAIVALHGDVLSQHAGDPLWDRVGIVRYPSRASFFAMQEREDFKQQYVHKKAGMEFTIVMGCLPTVVADAAPMVDDGYVMRVRRFDDGASVGDDPAGVTPIARFQVDGVILGDDRRWDEVRFDLADDRTMRQMCDVAGVAEQVVVRVGRDIDHLIDSVSTAPITPGQ